VPIQEQSRVRLHQVLTELGLLKGIARAAG